MRSTFITVLGNILYRMQNSYRAQGALLSNQHYWRYRLSFPAFIWLKVASKCCPFIKENFTAAWQTWISFSSGKKKIFYSNAALVPHTVIVIVFTTLHHHAIQYVLHALWCVSDTGKQMMSRKQTLKAEKFQKQHYIFVWASFGLLLFCPSCAVLGIQ